MSGLDAGEAGVVVVGVGLCPGGHRPVADPLPGRDVRRAALPHPRRRAAGHRGDERSDRTARRRAAVAVDVDGGTDVDRCPESVAPDQLQGHLAHVSRGHDLLEPHDALRHLEALHVLAQAKHQHPLPSLRPVAADPFEHSGPVLRQGREDVHPRLGPGHEFAIEVDDQVLMLARHFTVPRLRPFALSTLLERPPFQQFHRVCSAPRCGERCFRVGFDDRGSLAKLSERFGRDGYLQSGRIRPTTGRPDGPQSVKPPW